MVEDADLARAAALHRDGRFAEAVAAYRALLADDPENPGTWHNMGVALAETGEPGAALDAFDRALALRPDYLHAHTNRGGALQSLGRHADAAAAYGEALTLDPALYEIRLREGLMLLASGDRAGALEAFGRTHAIRRNPVAMGADHPSFSRSSRAKLAHDAAQLRHLAGTGVEGGRFGALAALYDRAAAGMPDGTVPTALPDDIRASLGRTYNRAIHAFEASEIRQGTLHPSFDGPDIEARYRTTAPGIAVIDDVLSPEALDTLYRHLLESTIWHDCEHIPGFLAAYLEDGLACPVLLQIVDELRAALPAVLGPHPLMQAWAFKCLTGSRGIDIHADSGAVSLNLWLTPDEGEPRTRRRRAHGPPRPAARGMGDRRLRPGQGPDPRLARWKRGRRRHRFAYAQNRAVLFRSDLFHESGRVRFRPGYANHRINMTLLFGDRS